MRLAQALVLALASTMVLHAGVNALILQPTAKDVERALKLAQGREAQRAEFHQPYIVHPDHPALEQLEAITEYRRYVMATEEQLRMGNWLFAQSAQRAQEKLASWRGRLTVAARLRFHPQNTLIGLPPYELAIANPDLAPLELTRTPINAMLSGRRNDLHAPLIGATLEAVFDAAVIGQTARPVILSLNGQPVASVIFDFSKLD